MVNDPFRDRLAKLADDANAPRADMKAMMRLVRRRGVIRGIGATAVVATFALAIIVPVRGLMGLGEDPVRGPAIPNEEGPAGSGFLKIDGIKITDPLNDRSQVEAQAVVAWSGNEFPGVYNCAFIARDLNGRDVGRYEDILLSLSPMASFPVKVDASSPASSMDAECGSRLDVGTPYRYDLSNVRVESGDEAPGVTRGDAVTVEFDAKWAAEGQAGAVRCQVAILDDGGAVVGSKDLNLFILTGSGTGLTTAVEVNGTPAAANFDCSPFSG